MWKKWTLRQRIQNNPELLEKFTELQKHPERQQKKIKKTIHETHMFNKNTETIKEKKQILQWHNTMTDWIIQIRASTAISSHSIENQWSRIIGIPEREERDTGTESIFKEYELKTSYTVQEICTSRPKESQIGWTFSGL